MSGRLWIAAGVAVAFLAQTGGLIVQGGQLRAERAETARLEERLTTANKRADNAEKAARAAEAVGARQAEQTAVICQGEGAELFNRGRQVGLAIGRAQCPAP